MNLFKFRKRKKETQKEKILRLCRELREEMGKETMYIFDYNDGNFSVNNQSNSIDIKS